MKNTLFFICILLASLSASAQNDPKISIFADHIKEISRQEHVTFADAALNIRAIGYTGVDVWVTQNTIELDLLSSMGFEFSCAILEINYMLGPDRKSEDKALEFMRKWNIKNLLVVPGLMGEGNYDHHFEATRKSLVAFAERAEKEGFKVLVEDYDNAASPCYNTERLTALFASSPSLGHVFDSGNYLYAGEDCLIALDKFKKNVGHVHLKDRVSAEDMSCPAVGDGCIPIKKAVKTLKAAGYKGWYTVEFFDNPSMLSAAEKSYKFVSKIVK